MLSIPVYAASIDLTNWSAVAYDGTGGTMNNPIWDLGVDPTTVKHTTNAKSSIFVSDFSIDQGGFLGTFEVQNRNDDDQIGFVFGVQDTGAGTDLASYYLFQWKAGESVKKGAAIRRLDGSAPTDDDLEGVADTASSTILQRDTSKIWSSSIKYSFAVMFSGTGFNLTVTDADLNAIINWDIADTTYTNGLFGFYNSSLKNVLYSIELAPVPVPPALWLFGSGLLGLIGIARRKNAA